MVRVPTHSAPPHPGEILAEEFLQPLGLTQSELARRVGVSFQRVNELVNGKRGITADTALRFARLFRTSPEFWLNLQLAWDLWHALYGRKAPEIELIEPLPATGTD